jgi:hypothetical protein
MRMPLCRREVKMHKPDAISQTQSVVPAVLGEELKGGKGDRGGLRSRRGLGAGGVRSSLPVIN